MTDEMALDHPIEWITANTTDRFLLGEIETLLARHPRLLHLIFDKQRPQLREPSSAIIGRTRSLSSGEHLLIRLALDIWNSSGNVNILEPIHRLDHDNFHNLVTCLYRLRSR
jgi:hypothetical protein